jgi:ubiquinone/menaquinone biosynthesis C-methylase UbiE
VDDLDRALGETLRVLKPGGRFVFLEHVAAPRGTWLRRLQRLAHPVWRIVADGCHPDRETDAAIVAAGFVAVRLERFSLPMGLVGPHIAGVALKGPSP